MPNLEECVCPVCKGLPRPEFVRLKNDRKGTMTVYTKLHCDECKMWWTPDTGWKPLNPKTAAK